MKEIKNLILTIAGTMITGMGIGLFLTPNKIVGGGVSGISTMLFHMLKVPPGLTYIVINLIFLMLGLKLLGREFTLKTLLGTALLSGFVQIFSYFPIYTQNTMLAAIFGGALYGMGIGLGFASGASTGGTDILGRMIQKWFPTLPIGKILLGVDSVIIIASYLVFGEIELTLLGVMTLIISSYAIDVVISKLNISRLAFVITDKGDEISRNLVTTSPRGVTVIDVVGAYTGENKKMLFCALKEGESADFQRKILHIDPEAFIVFSESQRIKGNGFYLYK